MGDPTKLVLGGLVNDLPSEERVLTDIARQNLVGHTIEARVFFEGEQQARFEAAGIIEHITVDFSEENGSKNPKYALITFRGREKSKNGKGNKDRLYQLGIGRLTSVDEYQSGYNLNMHVYSN